MNEPVVERVPGTPNLLIGAYDVATVGYSAQEFFVSGTATSYGAATRTIPRTTRRASSS